MDVIKDWLESEQSIRLCGGKNPGLIAGIFIFNYQFYNQAKASSIISRLISMLMSPVSDNAVMPCFSNAVTTSSI